MSILEKAKAPDDVPLPSERSFSYVFCIVFTALGGWLGQSVSAYFYGFIALGLGILMLGLLCPRVLAVPNKVWFKFGLLLHMIVSPIMLGVLYVVAILPMGVLMRALGKDLLHLKSAPKAKTYWGKPDPIETMKN
jgi:hypothetical protein